ncbi:MAG: hypothetical protein GX640_09590 [Fibrobacter sp.]|nr:hypothetical protein [Fibrobacter sp.]
MPGFVFTLLAILVIAFLIMLTIQLIRIERTIIDISEVTEARVKKLYGKKDL